MMDEKFKSYSLTQMENAYLNGFVNHDELEAYLSAWNATPGRFTVAYWQDGAIRQAIRQD